MSGLIWPTKDSNDVLDFTIDWSARVVDDDVIALSEWIVPDGLTKGATTFSERLTTVWLSGGENGNSYDVVNRITTAAGRVMEQTVALPIVDQ